jgi:secondary thiamine-phosphate synthase enzyme
MRTHTETYRARTAEPFDFADVTDHVESAVAVAGFESARVTVLTTDEGCALVVNERESGLLKDIKRVAERVGGRRTGGRRDTIGSSSIVVPVIGGRLALGTWQRILLVEFTGAATREVVIQVAGE